MVDIDGTICTQIRPKPDYPKHKPHKERIEAMNKLYDEGHTIVYWTARGSKTQINWYNLTKKQLDSWGAKYHELKVDKPYYDLFIDDRTIPIEKL